MILARAEKQCFFLSIRAKILTQNSLSEPKPDDFLYRILKLQKQMRRIAYLKLKVSSDVMVSRGGIQHYIWRGGLM